MATVAEQTKLYLSIYMYIANMCALMFPIEPPLIWSLRKLSHIYIYILTMCGIGASI